jgi:hypothetical protein
MSTSARAHGASRRNLKGCRSMHLVPVVAPLPGESVMSWCGRVARYHAEMTSHDFLQSTQLRPVVGFCAAVDKRGVRQSDPNQHRWLA